MLGKLIKYDLKWIYKVMIIFYILALLFSIAARGFSSIENSTIFHMIGQICLAISIAMIINCLINNLMRVWVRFMRNMYKDESYLTHTLPVSKNTLYFAKILSAIISMFITVIVIGICLMICFYSKENIETLKSMLQIVASNYETNVMTLLISVGIVFFLEMVFALLSGVLGIIVGHKSNNLKNAKSVIYGFIFYMIAQIFTIACIFIIGLFNQNVMNLFVTSDIISINAIKTIMYSGIILYFIYCTIYYFIGKKQFAKGINVD